MEKFEHTRVICFKLFMEAFLVQVPLIKSYFSSVSPLYFLSLLNFYKFILSQTDDVRLEARSQMLFTILLNLAFIKTYSKS